MKKKVSLYTVGCRLNFSETAQMANTFVKKGYEVVPFGDKAHITVVNTCTVTDRADATCRNLIRKAKHHSPDGRVVVAGCYAQMESEKIAQMPDVNLVLGTSAKRDIVKHLSSTTSVHIEQSREFWEAMNGAVGGRTRTFFKIQDGCNYRCSFCIIPQARGPSRSLAIRDALLHIKDLVQQNTKEIVLTGVNIGEYENYRGESLASLIGEILKLKHISRLRLSSVEPNTITKELLEVLLQSRKFMPHFHIPLQSGSEIILKKMRRRYGAEEYKNLIWRIKDLFPTAAFGADIICGFPGETEKCFEKTYNLVKNTPLTHLHVFPYSRRRGTMASKMEGQVEEGVKKARVKRLIALGEEKHYNFMNLHLSQTSEVLFENCDTKGRWWGYTPNYLKTFVLGHKNLHNKILKVQHQKIAGKTFKSSLVCF